MTLRTLCTLLCCTLASFGLQAEQQTTDMSATLKVHAPSIGYENIVMQVVEHYTHHVTEPNEEGMRKLLPTEYTLSCSYPDEGVVATWTVPEWGQFELQEFSFGDYSYFGWNCETPELAVDLGPCYGTHPQVEGMFREAVEDLANLCMLDGGNVFEVHPANILAELENLELEDLSTQVDVTFIREDEPEGPGRSFHLELASTQLADFSDLENMLLLTLFDAEPVLLMLFELDDPAMRSVLDDSNPNISISLSASAIWSDADALDWGLDYELSVTIPIEDEGGSLEFTAKREIHSK